MMFLAVLAAAATAIFRVRRASLDGATLAKGMLIAIVTGWLFGRVGLWLDGTARDAGLRILSPTYAAPGSLTYFLLGVCAGLLIFAAIIGRTAWNYFDALAPSTFVALAFAKIGCLFGGCCAGSLCPSALGITYPYGTPAYEHQYRAGKLAVPDNLLRPGEHKDDSPFWGELQVISLQPEFLARRVESAGLPGDSAPRILEGASSHRSLPVWPVPIAVSVTSLALWMAAERVYRASQRPGTTVAFVFAGYGLLRLTFDWFIAQRGSTHFGMTVAQWVGVCALALGAAVYARRAKPAPPEH